MPFPEKIRIAVRNSTTGQVLGMSSASIVHAARLVRDLNFKYLQAGKGAPVTARFGKDGITIVDPNRAGKVFKRIYEQEI